jgi:hypothetical protein
MKRMSLRPATDGSIKAIRRILVFDDHPDSLRLIFGRPANQGVYPTPGAHAGLQGFILPGMAILAALIAMGWLIL